MRTGYQNCYIKESIVDSVGHCRAFGEETRENNFSAYLSIISFFFVFGFCFYFCFLHTCLIIRLATMVAVKDALRYVGTSGVWV